MQLSLVQQLKIYVCALPEVLFISSFKTFGPGVEVKIHYLLQISVRRTQEMLYLVIWLRFLNI